MDETGLVKLQWNENEDQNGSLAQKFAQHLRYGALFVLRQNARPLGICSREVYTLGRVYRHSCRIHSLYITNYSTE
jgi:hypothetical protein